MKKLDVSLVENFSDNELPLFLDTDNVFIKDKNLVDVIDVIMIKKDTKFDKLMFNKYGGNTLIEQFNITKIITPLILIYNEISDITEIKPGLFIKFPELNSLIANTYIFDDLKKQLSDSLDFNNKFESQHLPGLNSINKFNFNLKQKKVDKTKTIGTPSIGITKNKVEYNEEKGIIIF